MTAFFYNLLVFFTYLTPGHYVWVAIIVITLILRFAFLPSGLKMLHVQHKQKRLQPELEKLKEVHKGDKQAEQKATMDLYKREGVNPLSSCLPMIAQIVVLIFFYRVFTTIGLGPIKTQFLYSFVPHPDVLNSTFFGFDLARSVAQIFKDGGVMGYLVWIFPLLAGGTQLIQALQMRALQPKTSGQGEGLQKAMNTQFTFLFPLMTAYISYELTLALSFYWITQTVFMIAQQKYAMSKMEPQILACEPVVPGQIPPKISKRGDVIVEVRTKGEKE